MLPFFENFNTDNVLVDVNYVSVFAQTFSEKISVNMF